MLLLVLDSSSNDVVTAEDWLRQHIPAFRLLHL